MKINNTLPFVVLSFLFAFGVQTTNAQLFPDNVKAVVQEAKRSSVSIESAQSVDSISRVNPTVLGSGVLVLKNKHVYIVTNSHVYHSLPRANTLLVGLNLKHGKIYNPAKLVVDDPKQDIAILSYSDDFYSLAILDTSQMNVDQASTRISMFADSTAFSEGTSIITIGFPLGIGSDISHNLPIVRRGIVAQGLNADNHFLVDGIASHGNSGSPVFNLNDAKLLGIVAAFPSDFITAYDENGQLVARLPYNSGLSVCISASAIWKLLP